MTVDVEGRIDPEKTWNEDMADLPAFGVGNYYWKQYTGSGLFDLDKKYRDYTPEERNLLLFGSRERPSRRNTSENPLSSADPAS